MPFAPRRFAVRTSRRTSSHKADIMAPGQASAPPNEPRQGARSDETIHRDSGRGGRGLRRLRPQARRTRARASRSARAAPPGCTTPLAAASRRSCRRYVPGVDATAEVTGGSVANLQLIGGGKSELGFTMADSAWDAYNGFDKFKDKKVGVRTLVGLLPQPHAGRHGRGTGIKTMADLKGKRVATGSPGSGTEVMSMRLLEAFGLDPDKDVNRGAPLARGERERPQGRQGRRADLGGRRADPRPHGSRGHPGQDDQADRPRRRRRGDAQEVRPDLREEQDPRQRLPRRDARHHQRRRLEPARGAGERPTRTSSTRSRRPCSRRRTSW